MESKEIKSSCSLKSYAENIKTEQNNTQNQPGLLSQDTQEPVSKPKGRMARAIEFLCDKLDDDGIEIEVEIDITPIVRVIEFLSEKYKNLTKYAENLKNNKKTH